MWCLRVNPKLEGEAASCPSLREEEGNLERSSLLFNTNKFLIVDDYDVLHTVFMVILHLHVS